MKNIKLCVLDKSTGDVGKVRKIYGSGHGFSAVEIVFDSMKPKRAVPVEHVQLLSIEGFDQWNVVEVLKDHTMVPDLFLAKMRSDLMSRGETDHKGRTVVNLGASLWNRLNDLVKYKKPGKKVEYDVPEVLSMWNHTNGSQYRVINITNLKASAENALKYPPTVVYENSNGDLWSRNLDDWHRSFTEAKETSF